MLPARCLLHTQHSVITLHLFGRTVLGVGWLTFWTGKNQTGTGRIPLNQAFNCEKVACKTSAHPWLGPTTPTSDCWMLFTWTNCRPEASGAIDRQKTRHGRKMWWYSLLQDSAEVKFVEHITYEHANWPKYYHWRNGILRFRTVEQDPMREEHRPRCLRIGCRRRYLFLRGAR